MVLLSPCFLSVALGTLVLGHAVPGRRRGLLAPSMQYAAAVAPSTEETPAADTTRTPVFRQFAVLAAVRSSSSTSDDTSTSAPVLRELAVSTTESSAASSSPTASSTTTSSSPPAATVLRDASSSPTTESLAVSSSSTARSSTASPSHTDESSSTTSPSPTVASLTASPSETQHKDDAHDSTIHWNPYYHGPVPADEEEKPRHRHVPIAYDHGEKVESETDKHDKDAPSSVHHKPLSPSRFKFNFPYHQEEKPQQHEGKDKYKEGHGGKDNFKNHGEKEKSKAHRGKGKHADRSPHEMSEDDDDSFEDFSGPDQTEDYDDGSTYDNPSDYKPGQADDDTGSPSRYPDPSRNGGDYNDGSYSNGSNDGFSKPGQDGVDGQGNDGGGNDGDLATGVDRPAQYGDQNGQQPDNGAPSFAETIPGGNVPSLNQGGIGQLGSNAGTSDSEPAPELSFSPSSGSNNHADVGTPFFAGSGSSANPGPDNGAPREPFELQTSSSSPPKGSSSDTAASNLVWTGTVGAPNGLDNPVVDSHMEGSNMGSAIDNLPLGMGSSSDGGGDAPPTSGFDSSGVAGGLFGVLPVIPAGSPPGPNIGGGPDDSDIADLDFGAPIGSSNGGSDSHDFDGGDDESLVDTTPVIAPVDSEQSSAVDFVGGALAGVAQGQSGSPSDLQVGNAGESDSDMTDFDMSLPLGPGDGGAFVDNGDAEPPLIDTTPHTAPVDSQQASADDLIGALAGAAQGQAAAPIAGVAGFAGSNSPGPSDVGDSSNDIADLDLSSIGGGDDAANNGYYDHIISSPPQPNIDSLSQASGDDLLDFDVGQAASDPARGGSVSVDDSEIDTSSSSHSFDHGATLGDTDGFGLGIPFGGPSVSSGSGNGGGGGSSPVISHPSPNGDTRGGSGSGFSIPVVGFGDGDNDGGFADGGSHSPNGDTRGGSGSGFSIPIEFGDGDSDGGSRPPPVIGRPSPNSGTRGSSGSGLSIPIVGFAHGGSQGDDDDNRNGPGFSVSRPRPNVHPVFQPSSNSGLGSRPSLGSSGDSDLFDFGYGAPFKSNGIGHDDAGHISRPTVNHPPISGSSGGSRSHSSETLGSGFILPFGSSGAYGPGVDYRPGVATHSSPVNDGPSSGLSGVRGGGQDSGSDLFLFGSGRQGDDRGGTSNIAVNRPSGKADVGAISGGLLSGFGSPGGGQRQVVPASSNNGGLNGNRVASNASPGNVYNGGIGRIQSGSSQSVNHPSVDSGSTRSHGGTGNNIYRVFEEHWQSSESTGVSGSREVVSGTGSSARPNSQQSIGSNSAASNSRSQLGTLRSSARPVVLMSSSSTLRPLRLKRSDRTAARQRVQRRGRGIADEVGQLQHRVRAANSGVGKRQATAGDVLSTLGGAAGALPQAPAMPNAPSTPQAPAAPAAPAVPSTPAAADSPVNVDAVDRRSRTFSWPSPEKRQATTDGILSTANDAIAVVPQVNPAAAAAALPVSANNNKVVYVPGSRTRMIKRQATAGDVLETLGGVAGALPQVPAVPGAPGVPAAPGAPGVPAAPSAPAAPAAPAAPPAQSPAASAPASSAESVAAASATLI